MKLSLVVLILGSASAFVPTNVSPSRAFVRPRMSDADAEPAPSAPKASAPSPILGGKIVPVKEETVQFTAGLVGGAAGFVIGGPVLGAIGAALANYASKKNDDVGELVNAVSKTSIDVYNYVSKLDEKYELLNKAKGSLETALDKLKSSGNVNPATVSKVENALASTTSKIQEVNQEYDLVGAGNTALGVAGELVEKAIAKAGELNSEYKLTDKGMDAIKKGVDKAKEKI